MRRIIVAASLIGILALTAVLVLKPSPSPAEGPAKGEPPPVLPLKAAGPQLPMAQVVLFSSGVGYFQREGEVEGNARVDLAFPVSDVNDLLKSLVLQDGGGGKISAVRYDGADPLDKTLRSFALDLTGNPTFGELLNMARGEKVEVTMQQT